MINKNALTKDDRWKIADKLAEDRLDSINLGLEDVSPSKTFYAQYGKRIIDVVISVIALLVTLPFNLTLGIITFFDLGAPIFFAQKRAGKDGKVFTLLKFRNMNNAVGANGELLPPEERVTKIGRFVRKTSMDELLNFWSILKGDMSVIGPRPLPPEYTHRYNKRHVHRLDVRPGLECPPRKRLTSILTW